ncbi:MAG: tetratricopeptide repeat protein [Nitrosopumilus sp.]|nr:tetratricopeptide repeat protein [Nitrosopumilus sp.]
MTFKKTKLSIAKLTQKQRKRTDCTKVKKNRSAKALSSVILMSVLIFSSAISVPNSIAEENSNVNSQHSHMIDNNDWIKFDENRPDFSTLNWASLDWSQLDWSSIDWNKIHNSPSELAEIDWKDIDWNKVDWDTINLSETTKKRLEYNLYKELFMYEINPYLIDWSEIDFTKIDLSEIRLSEIKTSKIDLSHIDLYVISLSDSDIPNEKLSLSYLVMPMAYAFWDKLVDVVVGAVGGYILGGTIGFFAGAIAGGIKGKEWIVSKIRMIQDWVNENFGGVVICAEFHDNGEFKQPCVKRTGDVNVDTRNLIVLIPEDNLRTEDFKLYVKKPNISFQVEDRNQVKVVRDWGITRDEFRYGYNIISDRFNAVTNHFGPPDPKKYGKEIDITTDGTNTVFVTITSSYGGETLRFSFDDYWKLIDRTMFSASTSIHVENDNQVKIIKKSGSKVHEYIYGYNIFSNIFNILTGTNFTPPDPKKYGKEIDITTDGKSLVNVQVTSFYGGEASSFSYDNGFKILNREILSPANTVLVDKESNIVMVIRDVGSSKHEKVFVFDSHRNLFYPKSVTSTLEVNKSGNTKIILQYDGQNLVTVTKTQADQSRTVLQFVFEGTKFERISSEYFPGIIEDCKYENKLNKIGNYEKAIDCYQKMFEIFPEREPHAKTEIVIALIGLEQYEQANTEVNNIIIKYPEYQYAKNAKALLEYRKQNYDEAKKLYEEVLSINPQNSDANTGLGNVLRLNGDIKGAAYRYYLADKYAIDPTEKSVAKNAFGLMHQTIFAMTKQIGNLDTSESFRDSAILLDDENVDGYNGKGTALLLKGIALNDRSFCTKAKESFEKTLSIYEKNEDALNGMYIVKAECEKKTQQNK